MSFMFTSELLVVANYEQYNVSFLKEKKDVVDNEFLPVQVGFLSNGFEF